MCAAAAPNPDAKPERRLAAILAVDAVGYSRLMGRDEVGTLARLKACREEVSEPAFARHAGRVVKHIGDGTLVEFQSAVTAVRAAVEIQRAMAARNAGLPENERIEFRIGINLGDIIIEPDGDIYGDGVNIAARIESLADPGGVVVARSIRDQVKDKLDLAFALLGPRQLKNIKDPVTLWRVDLAGSTGRPTWRRFPGPERRRAAYAVVALVAAVAVASIAVTRVWPEPARSPEPARGAMPDRPSLAVLAFDNFSGDPEQDFLADGITAGIITELARNRDLTIIARNTSFSFKGKGLNAQQVGQELGVKYVVEGSVRRSAESLRITAQLVDSASGQHVWADRYDAAATDIIATQDSIIGRIVGTLFSHLRETEKVKALRRPIDNFDAYELTLRGIAHGYQFTRDSVLAGRRELQRAIDLDPDYAPAHAVLGYLDAADSVQLISGERTPADLPAAIATIRRAIALDPQLPFAYQALGWALARAGAVEESLAAARKSVELAPSDADTLIAAASAETSAGNYSAAADMARRAAELNPTRPMYYYAVEARILYPLGAFERILALTRECLTQAQHYAVCQIWEMVALAALGRRAEARRQVERIIELQPSYSTQAVLKMIDYPRHPDLTASLARHLRTAGLPDRTRPSN
jgi:adenylate cyclase